MSNELTRQSFSSVEKSMEDAGFKPERVKQEISFALQHINKSAQLQKCSPQSLQVAVLNISNVGLSLNPAAKEAYLIPRYVNGGMEAVLEPSYVGLVKLLTDAGSVKSMLCQLVYENDGFSLDLANNQSPIVHKPELRSDKRGKVIGVYALATLLDGTRQPEWMDIQEVYQIRDRSETYKAFIAGKIKSCTWVTDEGEMSRKTVVKRIYKYLPRTERMQQIDNAIQYDNVDYMASDDQLSYIDNLLHTSTLEQRQREMLELEMTVMNGQRASEVITMLKMNQQQTDKEAFKRLVKQHP